MMDDQGQATGYCVITFPTAGVYQVSTGYVSTDPGYESVTGPSITIDVN
jgi:hypothetical protein